MAKAGLGGHRRDGFLSDIVGGEVMVNTPNGVATQIVPFHMGSVFPP